MQQPNRECQTCGKAYYFCNCAHNKDKFHWKMNCCSPQHFQVFIIALDLRDSLIDETQARKQLSLVGFTKRDLAWCTPSISDILSRAFQKKKRDQEEVVEGE